MLICLSGNYVGQELALHFGRLPPAFLPVGAERLFQLQQRYLGHGERFVLSLPDDFELEELERAHLEALGIETVFTDRGLNLCQAIHTLLMNAPEDEPVRILFGDTLVVPSGLFANMTDFVAVKQAVVDYPWVYGVSNEQGVRFVSGTVSEQEHGRAVCGYFEFSDLALLRRAFEENSLEGALGFYAQRRELTLVEAMHWYDFGHLTLFYLCKKELLVARAFNTLRSDGYSIVKTSDQTQKMRAEAEWFENVPKEVLLNTPRYIGRVNENYKAGYRLEYLYAPTLSDISVFGRASRDTWTLILTQCLQLLDKFSRITPEPSSPEDSPGFANYFYQNIFIDKTWSRLEALCRDTEITLESKITLNDRQLPPLSEIVRTVLSHIPKTTVQDICFWHGDFFFGNLFFDFNTRRVIMIDPRGQLSDGSLSQFGDRRYDIGKLAHSILGGYDSIIAGRSTFSRPTPLEFQFRIAGYDEDGHNFLTHRFLSLTKSKLDLEPNTVRALGAVMFFSMLPLHNEDPDRQMRLLASGLNQYCLLET